MTTYMWILPWGLTLVAILGWILFARTDYGTANFWGYFLGITGTIAGAILHLTCTLAPMGGREPAYFAPDSIARNDTHLIVSLGEEAMTSAEVRLYKADDSEILVEESRGLNGYGYRIPTHDKYSIVLAGDVKATNTCTE